MRTLTKKQVLIVQKINQLRDSLMSANLNKTQTDFILDVISRLNISLIDISNQEKIEKLCPKCYNELEEETCEDIDYPFVCLECDENFYNFETN